MRNLVICLVLIATVVDTSWGRGRGVGAEPTVTAAVNAGNAVTYAKFRTSWDAVMLPWIAKLSGLSWDEQSRSWKATPGWASPESGVGPNIYYLEQALRPATRMAIVKQDIPFMEELASFHLELLRQRTITLGALQPSHIGGGIDLIDGLPSNRLFEWRQRSGAGVHASDPQLSTVQYLSTAARLMRAIAEMPKAQRTKPLLAFVNEYRPFLVSDQLLRLLYGRSPIAYSYDKNIPQPVVQAWVFLAKTGYAAPYPLHYRSAMSDAELWVLADAAEVLGADAADPSLGVLDGKSRAQLKQAVQAGVSVLSSRCHHVTAPDGADVLSVFAGDYDGHPDVAYSGIASGPETPTTPKGKPGLSWDVSHSYRLPIVFRALYDTRSATGVEFPQKSDLVALSNTYVHLALDKESKLPVFNNYLDGSNGWYRVGYPSLPKGYPPHQYCQAKESGNCLTPGALQGWGQLAFVNPQLATLEQTLIKLAYDDSPETVKFKEQYFYYNGPYSANAPNYPWLMIYVVGDDAEELL